MKKAILGLSTLILSLILTGCPDRIIDISNFIEMECSTEDYEIGNIIYGHAKVNEEIEFILTSDINETVCLLFEQFPNSYELIYGKQIEEIQSFPENTEDHFYFSKFNMPSEEELREFMNQGKDISIYDIPNYYFEKKALILSLKSYEKFKKASVKVKFENPGEYKILLFSNLDEKEFFIRVTK